MQNNVLLMNAKEIVVMDNVYIIIILKNINVNVKIITQEKVIVRIVYINLILIHNVCSVLEIMILKHCVLNVIMVIQFHQIVHNVEEIMMNKKIVMDVTKDMILWKVVLDV